MFPCNSCKGPKRLAALTLSLILVLCCLPLTAFGQGGQKVVRVGWFDSSFCYWDTFGRRQGIDYEYQHKIAAYTGWRVEYVEDSWPNLFEKLEKGEIDLLSDVSYKPERAQYISYPDLPMGTESYYIYMDAANRTMTGDRPETFNGARIGVNKGSIQEGFLQEWADKYGITLTVIPMTADEDESMNMVVEGKLDGYAAIYSIGSAQKVQPVCRIGASEYFCAVNKRRPDILAQMNMALAGIQDEDPDFVRRLAEERIYNTRTDAYLSPAQEDWLEGHGPIKVGYRDGYLPFCQADGDTGELTGALKDYLAHAANNLRTVDVQFETVPYPSTQAALDAMRVGRWTACSRHISAPTTPTSRASG
jgi:ABC-type amino acid transport substrate-binding protein